MKTVYELTPLEEQHQKSFYGKAIVVADTDSEDVALYSYGTKIVVRGPNDNMYRCWNGWSATTGKHIKAFCGLGKDGYKRLPHINTRGGIANDLSG